jgi:hypothetical protein
MLFSLHNMEEKVIRAAQVSTLMVFQHSDMRQHISANFAHFSIVAANKRNSLTKNLPPEEPVFAKDKHLGTFCPATPRLTRAAITGGCHR